MIMLSKFVMRLRIAGLAWFALLSAFHISTVNAIDLSKTLPNASIVSTFSGPQGWRGHITRSPDGLKVIVWEAPDGLLLIGKLIDANGRDLSKLAQQHHQTNALAISVLSKMNVASDSLAKADDEPKAVADAAYKSLQGLDQSYYTTLNPSHIGQSDLESHGIDKQVYAFYDYQCPYCASALDFITNSGLPAQVHWLPVSILGNNSTNFGAAVLDGQIEIHRMGDLAGQTHPTPTVASLRAVAHNTAILKAIQGKASTPFFMYKNQQGEILSLSGFSEAAPDALRAMLSEG